MEPQLIIGTALVWMSIAMHPVYPVISFAPGRVHPQMRATLVGEHPSAELIKRMSGELQVTDEHRQRCCWARAMTISVGTT